MQVRMHKSIIYYLILNILILHALIDNTDARYSIINLSLNPSQVAPNNTSNIDIAVKFSNETSNISYGVINIKVDSRLQRPKNTLGSATGFMELAELKWVEDESKWSIRFNDPAFSSKGSAFARIPVIPNAIGTYNVSIERAGFRDNQGVIDDVRYSINPLKLNCSYPPRPRQINSTNSTPKPPAEPDEVQPTQICVEVNLPEQAYIYEPVEFTANFKGCGDINWCSLTFANSSEIKKWDKIPPEIEHSISLKYDIKNLPLGEHKLIFEAWNNNMEIAKKTMNISIIGLKLSISRTILQKEAIIEEPFDVIILAENDNNVDIQNATVRMELPEGIIPSESSDSKALRNSLNGNTLIETIPRSVPSNNKVYWDDIKLKGTKNITAKFVPYSYYFYYNNNRLNGTSAIDEAQITIIDQNSPSLLQTIYDWIKKIVDLFNLIKPILIGAAGILIAHVFLIPQYQKLKSSSDCMLFYDEGLDEAKESCSTSLRKDPLDFLPYYYIGMLLLKEDNINEAAENLNRARKHYPPGRYHLWLHLINRTWLKMWYKKDISDNYPELDLLLHAENVLMPGDLIKKLKDNSEISKDLNKYIADSIEIDLEDYDPNMLSEDNLDEIINSINRWLLTISFPNTGDSGITHYRKKKYIKSLSNNRMQLNKAYSGIVSGPIRSFKKKNISNK